MEEQLITPQTLFFSAIAVVIILCGVLIHFSSFHSPRAIFCSVGQGDASYIRIPPSFDILIDAGPDESVLECLGTYMPFYDKTIDLAILSHPDSDHYGGFVHVFPRYTVRHILAPPIDNTDDTFAPIRETLATKKALFPVAGDRITIPSGELYFLWPTTQYIEAQSIQSSSLLRTATGSKNSFSLIFICTIEDVTLLYTGDITPDLLPYVIIPEEYTIDVLKVPHHGSKNGLTASFLKQTNPDISIISAGENNKHNHPSGEILTLFDMAKKAYVRTDIHGDIQVEINSKKTPSYVLQYEGGNL